MDKMKSKIKSLLALAMSDNKHEADLALQRALELMNKNNLTRDEIDEQEFISEKIELKFKRTPYHVLFLHTEIARISGCIFTYGGHRRENQKGLITGRKRDVENTGYLTSFLEREVENQSKEYAKKLNKRLKAVNKKQRIKSFKLGLILSVVDRLEKDRSKFFNSSSIGAIIPVDTRVEEAKDYFQSNIGSMYGQVSKAKYNESSKLDGAVVGQGIRINQAVSGQSDILAIGGN
jgi:hypothetical protein